MKITNKLNLPLPFVKFVTDGEREYQEHRYSVTELLLPTREILLNRKYAHEIEYDVSDSVPALFGTAVHKVLEDNAPVLESGIESEAEVECKFGDYTLSGRIDLLNIPELTIEDYKTCSVSKVMKKDFDDWKMQGMMYAYLVFKQKGIIIRKLKFYALMKDWSKIKQANQSEYPASAIYTWEYNISDSDYDYAETWIKGKLNDLYFAESLSDDMLPNCTDEERWYTGTKYAVYKNVGDKKAAKVFDNEDDAHAFITESCGGAGEIQVRKGEYLKCKYYCACCKFCKKGEQV